MGVCRLKLLLLACLSGGFISVVAVNALAADVVSQPWQKPFFTMTVAVRAEQRERFVSQLEGLAYDSGFADRIDRTGPEHVRITMWREDLKIYGGNPFDRNEYEFGFYKNCGYPEIEASFFDFWIGEFKKAIDKVPGAEISDERPVK